jgi:molybdopterin-guanine dinucleotide biosynthesis protein A
LPAAILRAHGHDPDVAVVYEPAAPTQPLCGVIAALERRSDDGVIAVACDQPWVTAELLPALAARPEPVGRVRTFGDRSGSWRA